MCRSEITLWQEVMMSTLHHEMGCQMKQTDSRQILPLKITTGTMFNFDSDTDGHRHAHAMYEHLFEFDCNHHDPQLLFRLIKRPRKNQLNL